MSAPLRLFLDASVFIAAATSDTGGSALVLALCRQGDAQAVASRLVLLESERNIRAKLGRESLLGFYRGIVGLGLDLVEIPTDLEVAAQAKVIHPKEAHVLAAAIKGEIDFLLTLDRKHFLSLRAEFAFAILTPGEFLRRRLPYPRT